MTLENKNIEDKYHVIISNSEYFDEEWYSSSYDLEGYDAAFHYLHIGFKKGFNPGPIFNTNTYYELNPDVAHHELNPLLHYELYGREEGRIWKETPYVSVNDEISKYYELNTNKKRILLIGHDCHNAGAEILLKNIIIEFRNRDIEVAVLVKKSGPLLDTYKRLAPTFLVETGEKAKYYIQDLAKLGYKSAVLNTVICGDLIPIMHDNNFYIISLVHELPKVIKLLNAEKNVKLISEQADLVIFPSTFVAEKFENFFEIKGRKLIQPQGLYNYYNDFQNVESRKKLEKKYNIPSGNNIILNVGISTLIKGFDLFIEISKKLENKNYSFIWVGSINEEMKEKYCDEINDKNIIFPGFINDKDELMNFYDACDLFILTSREDPYPSVVLEAFNAKKPVIAFEDAGGFQDIVINNVSGFLVKFESVDEMVKKIELLCNDINLKDKLGNSAKEISNQHNFSNYVDVLILCCMNGEEVLALKNDIHLKNQKILDVKTINKENDNQISDLTVLNAQKNSKISKLKTKNKKLTNKNKKLTTKNKKLIKQNHELLNSSSWKITKPLRKIKSKVKPSSTNNKGVSNKKNSSKNDGKIIRDSNLKYSFIYPYPFYYKVHLFPENFKRVNIFFDKIDKNIYKFKNLFSFIIRYCKKLGYELRIIYSKADFELFNHFLEINDFELPKNSSFLNLKNNYLEISLNEKNICTSWVTAKRLINTKSLNNIIYFYLDDLNEYLFEESFQISKICYDKNVVILNDDENKLEKLSNYYYDYNININRKLNADKRSLCCDFGDMIIEGIDLLNYLFTNKILDINHWEIYIISQNNISRWYDDRNKHINIVSEKLNEYDLFLKFDYGSSKELIEDNCIQLLIKKVADENYNCLDISNYDFEGFDNFTLSGNNPKSFLQIGEIFNKLDEVD